MMQWRQQRKRGPAKGYIEGLENRLHDAESLLLQLLPLVSTEQLQAATTSLSDHDYDESGRASPDRRGSPPVLNKKTGIDYWDNFPLTSVAGIRRWQQDCEANHNTSNQNSTIKTETRNSSPGNQMLSSADSARKRQSVTGHRSQSSFGGDQGLDLYKMRDDQMSNQMMHSQNSQVAYDQQQRQQQPQQQQHNNNNNNNNNNNWQAMMMDVNTAQTSIPQQLFSQVGYLSNSWSQLQQQRQTIHLNNTDPSQQNSIAPASNQTSSHIFW
ncbi:hypothetical protein H2198_002161 [Neophaeococcomyces mojaviensis]|uniref:Uncharacterized protein n=1 Tax=Neophaeococcomyces mojaviensis TaxID=3383035 RepID=A0ACC3AER7_9EURO|nr:hypothetical protein H2198_002161 [Knufia sp. JES_112]